MRCRWLALASLRGWSVVLASMALALCIVPFRNAAAQEPDCQTGCTGGWSVDVTPDNAIDLHNPTMTKDTVSFMVKNTGTNEGENYTLACTAFGGITCFSVTPTSAWLDSGDSIFVTLIYNAGGSGGQVYLTASGHAGDQGWYNVRVYGAPAVALRNHNGDNRDRSLCLTVGAGEAAGWGCGDLVVGHGLPAYTTKGKARTLTLLYTSGQAVPRPVVASTVNEGTVAPPTTVFVQLSMNGLPRDSATYTGWGTTTPYVNQVVLAHDATTDSSGIYPFTLLVRNQYTGGTYDATLSDTLIVVNRATSRFGTGWSLVGVEELRTGQPGNKILWIGGDGSAKVYRNAGTNVWLSAAGAFRDTLTYNTSTSIYTRSLRHGVKVRFDAGGRHVRTLNRVGDSTTFTWSGSPLKLTSIQVPPGGSGTTYTLTYDGAGKLDRITDPAGRVLDVSVVSNRLTQIVDPDTTAYDTDFTYDAVGRMTGRTNRRGFTNSFIYPKGVRVDTIKVRLDTMTATYAVTSFRPWDEQGLAVAQTGQTAVDTTLVYTKIDGPRSNVADTAEFWIDRWGAPTRIRNPLGFETKLTRGDAANPALVTRVLDAAGAVAKATYNSRGNVVTVTDSTHQGSGASQEPAVTTFQYTDANDVDGPSKISTPVDTTIVTYNPTVRLPAQITAQGGHVATFSYTTSGALLGVLNSVTEQGVKVVDTIAWTKSLQSLTTTFAYDALGNDTSVAQPSGARTRRVRDAFTRLMSVYDPMNHRTDYVYNLLNWIKQVKVFETYPSAVTLITQYNYDRVGSLLSVLDPRNVTRSWAFNAAEQPVRMTDDVGNVEMRYFGTGGLLDSMRTRMGHVIKNTFDASGQLTKTIYPTNTFIQGTSIPGDSIRNTYDGAGRLLTATNSVGSVTYTYNLEGTVKTERQLVTGAVDITVRSWYDAGNRRTKFFNGTDTLSYTYGVNGLLAKLKVQWMAGGLAADSFNFFWDSLGRRDSLRYTNGTMVSYGYDRDGHIRMLCSRHPGGDAGELDFLEQRIRYQSENAEGLTLARYHYIAPDEGLSCTATSSQLQASITSAVYDARHQLWSSTGLPTNQTVHYDSSGNIRFKQLGVAADSFTIVANSNRLIARINGTPSDSFAYDPNGNRVQDKPNVLPGPGLKIYYYNSINQMVGDSETVLNGSYTQWIGGLTHCKYDALGRRVESCGALNTPYRVYDGDNTIMARSPSGNMQWRFVHGPGLDDPLVAAWSEQGDTTKYYYLTDGQGSQLGFTNVGGYNYSDQMIYTNKGGNQSGGIERAQRFDNSRAESADAPGLSFYRNRYYDQATGRWLTEDPIGIEGGLNLYAYSGNNPATFTDPFGLRLCFTGGASNPAIGTIERSTGTNIRDHLDDEGCVTDFDVVSFDKKYQLAQLMLKAVIESSIKVTVDYSGRYGFNSATGTLYLSDGDSRNYTGFKKCSGIGFFLRSIVRYPLETETEAAATTHELTHAYDYAVKLLTPQTPSNINSAERQYFEARAVVMEDAYNASAGRLLRCIYSN